MITLQTKTPIATPLERQLWVCSECGKEFRPTGAVYGRRTPKARVGLMRAQFEKHLVAHHGYVYQNVGLCQTRALPPRS